jgi:hypothetical protein
MPLAETSEVLNRIQATLARYDLHNSSSSSSGNTQLQTPSTAPPYRSSTVLSADRSASYKRVPPATSNIKFAATTPPPIPASYVSQPIYQAPQSEPLLYRQSVLANSSSSSADRELAASHTLLQAADDEQARMDAMEARLRRNMQREVYIYNCYELPELCI